MSNYRQRAARRRGRAAQPGITPIVVYIVRCVDDSYYTGYTVNLAVRIDQHNRGRGAKYTAGRTPVTLVYFHACKTVGDAMREEFRIKALSRTQKEKLIMSEENEFDGGYTHVAQPSIVEAPPLKPPVPPVELPKKAITKMGKFRVAERDDCVPRYIDKKQKSKNGLERRFLGWFNQFDLYIYEVPGHGWFPRAVKETTAANHGGIDLAIDIMEKGQAQHDNDLALVCAYVMAHNEGIPSCEMIPIGSNHFFDNYGELAVQAPMPPLGPYTPTEEEKNRLKKQLDLFAEDMTRTISNDMGTYNVTKPGKKHKAYVEFVQRTKWYNSQQHHKTMETYKALGYETHDSTRR